MPNATAQERSYDRKTARGLRAGMFVCAARWTHEYRSFQGYLVEVGNDTVTIRELAGTYLREAPYYREWETGRLLTVPRNLVRHAREAEKARARAGAAES